VASHHMGPSFNPKLVYVAFVMDKVAIGAGFSKSTCFPLLIMLINKVLIT
jgi:hypothetical protein